MEEGRISWKAQDTRESFPSPQNQTLLSLFPSEIEEWFQPENPFSLPKNTLGEREEAVRDAFDENLDN